MNRTERGRKIVGTMVCALFLSILHFAVMQCNADDAQGYNWIYRRYELGIVTENDSILNPMLLILSALHFLKIGSNGAELCMYYFAFWYFACVWLTLYLAVRSAKDNKWWLLLMAVFILIPSANTNRYHLIPTFVSLLLILLVSDYMETPRKRVLLCGGGGTLVLYTLVFVNDRAIFLLYAVVPLTVLGIIWCLQNKDRHKYLYMVMLFAALVAVLAVRFQNVYYDFFGKAMPLSEAWDGYGGASYLTWINVKSLFEKGIPSFFQALMNQYNIPVKGGMVQILSFFWIIRILIVGMMVAVWILRLRGIAKKGIEHMSMIDAVSAIAITVLTVVNIFNGIAALYDSITGLPINRYNELSWFLFVILLIRWVDEKYRAVELCKLKNKVITSNLILSMIFVLLVVGYAKPVNKDNFVKTCCRKEIAFLEENDNDYFCGLGGYWKAYPILAATSGKYVVCPGQIAKDEADSSILYVQMNNYNADTFSDGSNYFNFLVVDTGSGSLFNTENVEQIRGDYVSADTVQNSVIYLYDYDIRWDSRLIMEAVGEDYELTEPIAYYFDFPVGMNRIEMDVANSENFELAIEPNMDIGDVKIQKLSDNKIYVDLACKQNTSVTFHVGRAVDEYTTIHKIVLKRVRGAMEAEAEEIYLKEGSYIVTFEGDAVNRADITFEGEGISIKRLTNGRIKSRYQIDVNSAQYIKYKVDGKDAAVNKVYYENAVLFDEKVKDDSPYFWNL